MSLIFPPNPSVDEVFNRWLWDGEKWVLSAQQGSGAGYALLGTVVYDAAGTFTFDKADWSGIQAVTVKVQGGGGGGGAAEATAAAQGASAGGGGAGCYCETFILATSLSDSETVVVGAGGVRGTVANPGGNGGVSSFGGVTAGGGSGAIASLAVAQQFIAGLPGGGSGSVGGDPDIVIAGSGGMASSNSLERNYGGRGAQSPIGGRGGQGGNAVTAVGQDGGDGLWGGGGGGGSNRPAQTTARFGGTGGGGVVIVDVWGSAVAGQQGGGGGSGVLDFCAVSVATTLGVPATTNTTVIYNKLDGGQDWRNAGNTAVIVPTAGLYQITSNIEYVTQMTAATRLRNSIGAGGASFAADMVPAAVAHVAGGSKTVTVWLEAGASVGVIVWQGSAATNTLNNRTTLLVLRLDTPLGGGEGIERGSNANGEWTKWPDGTMQCWRRWTDSALAIDSAYGSWFVGNTTWVFPEPFIAPPVMTVGNARWSTGSSFGVGSGAPTETVGFIRIIDNVTRASGTAVVLSATAIGRWK